MHPEGHSSMLLLWNSTTHQCLLGKSENSSRLAALYSPGISRLSGWSSWAGGNKNGPNSMLGNLHRATMSSLELRALCLSVHTAHNLQHQYYNFAWEHTGTRRTMSGSSFAVGLSLKNKIFATSLLCQNSLRDDIHKKINYFKWALPVFFGHFHHHNHQDYYYFHHRNHHFYYQNQFELDSVIRA